MKRFLNIIRMLLVGVVFSTAAYAQPPNDACANATMLPVGVGTCDTTLYTNVAATSVGDPAAPNCWNPAALSHSVWFSFVITPQLNRLRSYALRKTTLYATPIARAGPQLLPTCFYSLYVCLWAPLGAILP